MSNRSYIDDNGKDPSVSAVEQSEEAGVTPGFLGGSDWPAGAAYKLNGEYYDGNDKKLKPNKKRTGAAGELFSAERSAENDILDQPSDDLDGNEHNEASPRGFYSGQGKMDKKGKSGGKNKKGGSMGRLKKGGPVGLIITAVLGIVGAISGMQLSQPFSLIAQFQETFNSMHTSANMRTKRIFGLQLGKQVKDPVKGTIFGRTLKITKKQREKLKQHGIEVDDDFQGTGTRVLKFMDGDEVKIVAADANAAKSIGNVSGVDADMGKAYNSKVFTFDDIYDQNTSFHHAYNKGSLTWRGQIANWFGTRVAAFLTNNKLTRNLFNDYESKKAAAGGDGLEAMKETLEEKTGSVEDGGEKVREYEEGKDEDGNDTGPKVKEEDTNADSSKMTRGDTNSLKSKMDKIKNKFASSANIVCGVSSAIGAISLAVSAAEALQVINLATSYFEAIDKVKAGNGSDAPINEMAGTLNEPKENTNVVLEKGDESKVGDNSNDKYDALLTKEVTTKKSAMQSEGVAALYSGRTVNSNDASVQSFNLTASVNKIMWGIGTSMDSFKACTIAKLAVAAAQAVDAAIDIVQCVLSVGAAIATEGAGIALAAKECVDLLVDVGIAVGKNIVVSTAIAAVFNTLMPMFTRMWTRDLISNIGGEDLGNALTSGGNMYLGGAHRANGGSPASMEKYKQYAVAHQQVIADNARFERESLSPFDLTSKNTFMGTLMTRLSSFASANSLVSVISSGSSVISSSVASLSPAASAYNIAEALPDSMEDYEKTCPYLASINMIGDAYCNPYVITDTTTINDNPADVITKVDEFNGLSDETTSDGNVKIAGDSDLAKYIRYCDNRSSMFGIADYNIVTDINSGTSANTGNTYVDAAVDGGIGAIPLIGDGIDIIEDAKALAHIGYISGESCVAGNDVDAASSPNWDKAKYYQRFIEDQSLAESMGMIDKSAVTAYLEEYYEEHPLDNSYEGIIARYSGLDKETVTDIMAIAKYYEYVNDYNPSERYAFGRPAVEVENELRFDNDNVVAGNVWATLADAISYADLRNRSYAV